jgi:hypothetical protein
VIDGTVPGPFPKGGILPIYIAKQTHGVDAYRAQAGVSPGRYFQPAASAG